MSVSVKMKPSDLEQFKNTAAAVWPGAVLTLSGIILGFAKLGVECVKCKGGAGRSR